MMHSRIVHSRRACSNNQSHTPRCTSGNGTRLRSGRGGKRPTLPPTPAPRLPLSPPLSDQQPVRQHHQPPVAVEARPQPPLVLVPAQKPLGLLVVLLHPVPSVGVLHQPLQRYTLAVVTPVVTALAVA